MQFGNFVEHTSFYAI